MDYTSILNTINSNILSLNASLNSLYQIGCYVFYGIVILIALNIIKGV